MRKCGHMKRLGPPCGKEATVKIRRKVHSPKCAWRYLCDSCSGTILPLVHEPINVVRLEFPEEVA